MASLVIREIPDKLKRDLKVHAASVDSSIKDLVVELIEREVKKGLVYQDEEQEKK